MPKPNVNIGDWVHYHHSDQGLPMLTMPALVTSVLSIDEQRVTLTAFPPPATRGAPGPTFQPYADRGVAFSEEPARTKWSWPPEE